ncbi:DUF5707 domain-containing protein [Streptomyces sp. NPDC005538]|uniref:DUF5707 domain-containing protein n=1 Tax=unclassified Streptomyces TaxID=2593676 RepID=UPI0033A60CD6
MSMPVSKRAVLSSLACVVATGGIIAGGLAASTASAANGATLAHGSTRYVAPTDSRAGSFTYAVDVNDDSGVRSLKVVAWPASSALVPTKADLRHAESATCERTSHDTSHCTYALKVTKKQAADLAKGTWYVSALATAEDGDTKFVSMAARFVVGG